MARNKELVTPAVEDADFYIRLLVRTGRSRYLNVSKILPVDWAAVKIHVVDSADSIITMRLEQIK